MAWDYFTINVDELAVVTHMPAHVYRVQVLYDYTLIMK